MRRTGRFGAFLLLLCAAPVAAAVSFDSPKGRFRVQVAPEGAQGRDMVPLAVILTPADGGAPITFMVNSPGYKAPTDREVREMFHFSPEETSVAVLSPRSISIKAYRLIALARQRWEGGDLDAESVEWVDDARLVYRGQDDHSFFIGVFDAVNGSTKKANPGLSLDTNFDVIRVTPKQLHFREEDRTTSEERCYSFDTRKGKRKTIPCP